MFLTPLRSRDLDVPNSRSTNAGHRYEKKVCKLIAEVFPCACFQEKVQNGIIDAIVYKDPIIIIEVKLTQTADGYYQLQRYASNYRTPVVRCIITSQVARHVVTPEQPSYLRTIADLQSAMPGYYVIPLIVRRSTV